MIIIMSQKGQLGRVMPEETSIKEKKKYWFALPGAVPGIGTTKYSSLNFAAD